MTLLEINTGRPELLAYNLTDGTTLGESLNALARDRHDIHQHLLEHTGEWPLGWLDLPANTEFPALCSSLAAELEDVDELIVCGIGGSALGTQAVYSALDWPVADLKPLIVVDNVDPTQIAQLVEYNGIHDAALNVISKSGGTLETMSGFFYLLKLAEEAAADTGGFQKMVVATTDPDKGLLRDLANSRGWHTLPVPGDVGGRFSVLSPVGLFPLAFAGIDISDLLAGAREMQEQCTGAAAIDNPAFRLAAIHYLLHTTSGIRETVQYMYGDPLVLLGDWFRQLWAESLAKSKTLDDQDSNICLTPVTARGTTDQHSQNQLYMEGLNDKLYGFITSREWALDAQVTLPDDEAVKPLKYMEGKSFGDILSACCQGTREALVEAGRPVYEITFPRLGAREVGAYLQLWMLATAYAGLLYNVNAYDQPGVERSKVIARDRLG